MVKYEIHDCESWETLAEGETLDYRTSRRHARAAARKFGRDCSIWYCGNEHNTQNGYKPVIILTSEDYKHTQKLPEPEISDAERTTEGRAQYLKFRLDGVRVSAGRVLITSDRFSPWVITEGRDALPTSHTTRGRLLSRIYNSLA